MENYCFVKDNLNDITKDYMSMVAKVVMNAGISTIAPLGFSGDHFYLYGRFIDTNESDDGKWHRESVVSFRNYCNMLEMLITDKSGKFLIYTQKDGLDFDELIDSFYLDFCSVKNLIVGNIKPTFEKTEVNNDAQLSAGFEILKNYTESR